MALANSKLYRAPWGEATSCFRLPNFDVQFVGLSELQKEIVDRDFKDFLYIDDSGSATQSSRPSLVCQSYRLREKLEIPPEKLTSAGQYAPLQVREAGVLKVTGLNFLAEFSVDELPRKQASLGVFAEEDFNVASVVENFLRFFTAYDASFGGGAVMHSAGVIIDDQAVVFVGHSNVGKTTLTRKAHAQGLTVLSDDLNLVLPILGGVGYRAFKVPFTGEFGRTVDQTKVLDNYPLKAVVLLEQADALSADFIEPSFAISKLLACSPFVNNDEEQISVLFDVYAQLTACMPIIKLKLTRTDSINEIASLISGLIRKYERNSFKNNQLAL